MAIHDYVIDNSTGANVRADINNALAAIVSNNSSSSQPTTRYAYMWWADTTTGILKIRNSANDGWVELLQLDGTLTLEDGSASSPGLAFRDDLNTGVFSSAADTFNIATGGVERLKLGTATIFNDGGNDVDFAIEGSSEANLFFVDAGNKKIGISSGSPISSLHVVDSGTGGDGTISIGGSNTNARGKLFYEISGSTHFDIQNSYRATSANAYIEYDAGYHIFTTGTSGNEAMRIQSGRLLIGTTTEGVSTADDLTIATSGNTGISLRSGTSSNGNLFFSDGTSGNDELRGYLQYDHSNNAMKFGVNAEEAILINSNKQVGIGISNNVNNDLQVRTFGTGNGTFMVGGGNGLGVGYRLSYSNSGNTSIEHKLNYHSTSNSAQSKYISGFHTFHTQTTGDERLRIENIRVLHNCTSATGGASAGVYVQEFLGHVYNAIKLRDTANTGNATFVQIVVGSSVVGNITATGSATSYNTSSDYRLKENETEITDGIARIKLLKPYKFNWKSDQTRIVDGFFAHEAQEVVPEAVTGKKDEIADCDIEGKNITKGQEIYQQMDNAKLIPVLTAAIKEAVSKIEVLETKVAALEAA